jgi:hypothetical protein
MQGCMARDIRQVGLPATGEISGHPVPLHVFLGPVVRLRLHQYVVQGHAKCESIARIPTSARAHAVEEHAGAEIDPLNEPGGLVVATHLGVLKGNESERSRDYPARCT